MEPFILRMKHQKAVVGWMGSALFFRANRQKLRCWVSTQQRRILCFTRFTEGMIVKSIEVVCW